VIVAGMVYFLLLYVMKIDELKMIRKIIWNKIFNLIISFKEFTWSWTFCFKYTLYQ
jgi:hypothetical protein